MAITIPKSIVPNIFTGLDHTSASNSNFVTDGHFLNRIAQARSTGNIHKNRQATKGAPTIAAGNKKSNESNLQGKLDAVARSGLILTFGQWTCGVHGYSKCLSRIDHSESCKC